jgi:hypothetical protein
MAICTQGLQVVWQIVCVIAVDMVDIQLAWVLSNKSTRCALYVLGIPALVFSTC